MMPSRWLIYPMALVVGAAAGRIAHSGVVAAGAALVFALVWLGIRDYL
jgi:hypothetical protein